MHPPFKLCYITGRGALSGHSIESFLGAAVEAGIDLIQIRENDLPARELIRLSKHAIRCAAGTPSRILINNRLDLALALGAAGVHLGNHSLPAPAVRAIIPRNFLVGVSCHSLADARAAESAGADYVLLSPVFETPLKLAFGPPLGLGRLQEVTERVSIPVFALGGITLDRVTPCLKAGAQGVAAIRLFQDAPSLSQRVAELRAKSL